MSRMPRTTVRPQPGDAEPPVRRGYFECRFGQLHVHHAMPPGGGFEEGTPLLCLHGTAGSGRMFRGFLPLLGRDRSGYAPDVPGCGESDGPAQPVATAEYAAAIADFLDTMRLRTVDLLAQGAGAVLATELALTRPTQVRRIVLVSVPLGNLTAAAGDFGAAAYPLRERLARVTQPLLVLRPRDGSWDAGARVREVQPAARVVDLPDQGEDLLQSAPGVAAEAVRPFLRG
jgi:pimeloyl-ACP methyl ester carboxylesterase